jgi:hypothetical protein
MPNESGLIRIVRSHRSALLLCALVIEMVIAPMADYHPHRGALLTAFVWLVFIAAAGYMANRTIVLWVILPIAFLWTIARILEAFGDPRHAYTRMAPVAGLALSCTVLWGIFERARKVPRAMSDAIAESFIGYLMIATAFAQLYWILSRVLENPFNQTIPAYEISTLVYFSLVTITSIGSGAIIPINPYVRMVAAFESITGIFYIAVVVARLVSSYRRSDFYQE